MHMNMDTIQKKLLLLDIFQSITEHAPFDNIINKCCELIGNPVVLLDMHLNILASSEALKPEFLHYLNSVRHEQFCSFFDLDGFALTTNGLAFYKHQQFQKILFQNKVYGYLCFLEYREPLSEHTKKYAQLISSALSGTLYETMIHGNASSGIYHVLVDLIQNGPKQPAQTRELLESNHWQTQEKYYLLVIDCNYQSLPAGHYDDLKRALPTPFYEYDHYYFSVIGCGWKETLRIGNFVSLCNCLETYHIRAGISNGFFDINQLSMAFHQCLKAIEFGVHYDYVPLLHMYENYIITHFTEIMDKYTPHSSLSMVHPLLVKILDYDKENGTDYMSILSAYLFSNLSVSQTAEALYMHTNTVYSRLKQMQSLFQLTFDNLGLNSSLLLSMNILGYYGLIDPQVWNRLFILREHELKKWNS